VHLESDEPGHFTESHEQLLDPLLQLAGPALGALHAGEHVLRTAERERTAAEVAREEAEDSRRFLARNWSFGRFVGRSPKVRELEERVRRASRMEFPVLIEGETGTGKSILARVLHHAGPRADAPLVTVFCPSLEKGMVETELFGHRRGAFTGADADRAGKVQAADGGTLFLDEIGELPLDIQPKLLRLLQEKTYERIGDAVERNADVRVIAATNRDLDAEVRAGRFRRDLYERLHFVPVHVPPLRDRRDDIPVLLRHCLDQHDDGRWITLDDVSNGFLVELDFTWPGNVRHLEQLAARLVLEAPEGPATPDLLERLLGQELARDASDDDGQPADPADLERGLPALLAESERRWLEEALRRYPALSRAELARLLKISETTLFKKLRQHGFTG
jgi:DNA-binding NtrC family response regulator